MYARIPSIFNLLKRVGFAVLVLGVNSSSQAQAPDTLWTRRYGNEFHDLAHSVAQTPDGGFIIAGETWDADTFETRNADAYLVKVDSLGNEEWSRRWGSAQSERINKIIVLEDGYMAAGTWGTSPPPTSVPSHGWLLRLDENGDTLWTRTVEDPNGFAWFEDMVAVEDGNYAATGVSRESGSIDFWVVKFAPNGDTLWTRSFGGSTAWDYGWAIILATDGGYAATGFTDSYGAGSSDMWLIKVSPDGDSLWSRTFGFGGLEEARAIALAPDGGFFLGGYSASLSATYDDAWIVRTDSLGNYVWDKDLAGEFQLGIEALVATEDGGVIAAGRDDPAGTNGQALYMAKVDSAGDSVWARSWFQDWYSYGRDLIQLADGGFAAVGGAGRHSDPTYTTGDMWFIRLSPDLSPVFPTGPYLPTEIALTAYPNPFNAQATIQFSLPRTTLTGITMYDVLGRVVQEFPAEMLQAGQHQIRIDAADLASGSYWVKLNTPNSAQTRRVLLLR
ncbi:MAG: T9SS type A sorting domain-containing protein [Calditrichaeota bacterium]|nr:T9SS type A sorting domain-containing protein [Calditrichota bacterium]